MQKLNGINMVIASGSETVQNYLREAFLKRGANVVLCDFLNLDFVSKLDQEDFFSIEDSVDVILIDMNDSYEEDEEALDRLIERIDLPLLFHDNDFDELNDPERGCGFSEQAIDKLANKLSKLVESDGTKREISKPPDIDQSTIEEAPQENSSDDLVLISDDLQDSLFVDKKGIVELEQQMQSVAKALSADNSQPVEDSLAAEGSLPVEDSLTAESSLSVEDSLPVEEYLAVEDSLPAESPVPVEDILSKEDYGSSLIEEVISVHKSLSENVSSAHSVNDNFDGAVNVWVLGASIGGPEAVKRFLARIPAELPVGFILAQHLGDGFVSLLATQLDRVSRFNVKEAKVGDTLRHGEVIVVPVENRMTLDSKGRVDFIEEAWKGHYKPSIDCVIKDVTSSYGRHSGIIIFSGMGADGVLASQEFAERYQGNIWAQTPDTCIISSMPDSVRKANLVSFSGSPEVLAMKISKLYMDKE